jgi:hypothetical protein
MGIYLLVAGFFLPVARLPKPFWLYPMHYIDFMTYVFAGFMKNEFDDTTGWACPCTEQPTGCIDPTCILTGHEVRTFSYIKDSLSLR